MRTLYKIIIGVSIPLVLFGIFVLLIAISVSEQLENTERWMVELEPHLDLSEDQLESQLRDEDLKDLTLYRVKTLDDYFDSFEPNFERSFREAYDTKNRFVVSIDEHHNYTVIEVQEILTDIDGIQEAWDLHDWLLRRN